VNLSQVLLSEVLFCRWNSKFHLSVLH